METQFKRSKARILKSWNDTIFRLFVPKTIDKNNKIEVHFNFFDPSSGKNKQIKKSNGIDRYAKEKDYVSQANDLVESLIELLSKGWNPITNEMPDYSKLNANSNIKDCVDSWLDLRESDVAAKIIKQDELKTTKMVLEYFIKYLKRNHLLFEKPSILTKTDIDQFMRWFEKNRKFEKPTFNSYLYRLNFFFKYLITERVITHNPAHGAFKYKTKLLATRNKIYNDLELADVKAKLELLPKYKDLKVAINLLYSYRIRGAEQLRIKIGMFDFKHNLLLLPEEVEENGEMVKMTKNGLAAAFKLSDEVIEMVLEYIGDENIKNKHYYLFGGHNKPKEKKCNKQFMTNLWTKFKKEFDLPDHLKWYALKHTSNSKTLLTTGSDQLSIINRHLSTSQINTYTAEMKRRQVIEVDDSHKF